MNWNKIIFWGNTPKDYAVAFGIVIIGMMILRILRIIIDRQAAKFSKQNKVNIYPKVKNIWKTGVLPLLYFILIFNAFQTLNLLHALDKTLKITIGVILVFYIARIIILILKTILDYHFTKQGRTQAKNALKGVFLLIYLFLWIVGGVFILGNLGYDVRTVLAGMGIGGIAIALGSQNVITDIIAYFSILFDNPFSVGDYIAVEGNEGSVKQIGIKTTRIQSLGGEELIYSNRNILDQWIHNYGRMPKRRASFTFNLAYETPAEKLKVIPKEIENIITQQEKVSVDNVHFIKFNEYGLLFQGIYYSLDLDYNAYLDKQQNINIRICELLENLQVNFALSADRNIKLLNTPDTKDLL